MDILMKPLAVQILSTCIASTGFAIEAMRETWIRTN